MPPDVLADVHETMQTLWDVGAVGRLTDAQLLRHVLAGPEARAEAAFTALVERHGPAVRRVCADLLRNPHDAEDAAQAVFLVLARKARSIRKPEALASWLHGAAVRLARKLRAAAARRRTVEQRGAWMMAARILSKAPDDLDPYVELHEEIDRLPEKYRSPIVLCDLEGHTQEQAAQRLGWPLGTVQSRLHRGRARLRARLVRCGVGLSLLTATGFGLPTRATAALPAGWARATASAAMRFATGQSTAGLVAPTVAHLAEGVLAQNAWKALAVVALAMGLAASGGVLLSAQPAAGVRKPEVKTAAPVAIAVAAAAAPRAEPKPLPPLAYKGPELDATIAAGVRFLKNAQQADGSWTELDKQTVNGTTSLVTLALVTADEPADSSVMHRASEYLRRFTPEKLNSVYAVSLQTRVFAALGLEQDRPRITENVEWLERAQIIDGDSVEWPGSWSYTQHKNRHGDGSNTHFALVGLNAAAAAGAPVRPIVWANALTHWNQAQQHDGSWAYTPNAPGSTASMTGAGVASLIECRSRLMECEDLPEGGDDRRCGKGDERAHVRWGLDWFNTKYQPRQNFGNNQQWRFYFLEALERVGSLTGERLLNGHDWFREEAEDLIHAQNPLDGSWKGVIVENDPLIATSFALLFLCHGRAPVLIQKAKHGPGDDWMNDPDDVRHLVDAVGGRKQPMNWQVVDLDAADVDDLLRAPILFFNGHEPPILNQRAKAALRAYLERGGFLFAEACCGKAGFDRGFRALMSELFPGPGTALHPIAHDRPVWTARHRLDPNRHALWGLEIGNRTAVMYSPTDLSCHWSLWGSARPKGPATVDAIRLGENIVVYARTRDDAERP